MGEFARALALEETFEWEGATYRLAALDRIEVIGLWEQWLADRAWARLEKRRGRMPDTELSRLREQLLARETAGDYDFFSVVSGDAIRSWDGRIEIVVIRIWVCLPDNERAEGRQAQLRKMLRRINEEALEKWAEIEMKMARQDADPNSPAPAKKATPGDDDASASPPSSPDSPTPTSSPASGAS